MSSPNNYLNFRGKYAEIKTLTRLASKPSMNSLDRIAEFRKKLESSFGSKPEKRFGAVDEEVTYTPSKYSLYMEKPQISRPPSLRISKENSLASSIVPKPKLNEIFSVESLIELKKALVAATEEEIQEIPYLYSYTLKNIYKNVNKKLQEL
jgi:hypothetical protein